MSAMIAKSSQSPSVQPSDSARIPSVSVVGSDAESIASQSSHIQTSNAGKTPYPFIIGSDTESIASQSSHLLCPYQVDAEALRGRLEAIHGDVNPRRPRLPRRDSELSYDPQKYYDEDEEEARRAEAERIERRAQESEDTESISDRCFRSRSPTPYPFHEAIPNTPTPPIDMRSVASAPVILQSYNGSLGDIREQQHASPDHEQQAQDVPQNPTAAEQHFIASPAIVTPSLAPAAESQSPVDFPARDPTLWTTGYPGFTVNMSEVLSWHGIVPAEDAQIVNRRTLMERILGWIREKTSRLRSKRLRFT